MLRLIVLSRLEAATMFRIASLSLLALSYAACTRDSQVQGTATVLSSITPRSNSSVVKTALSLPSYERLPLQAAAQRFGAAALTPSNPRFVLDDSSTLLTRTVGGANMLSATYFSVPEGTRITLRQSQTPTACYKAPPNAQVEQLGEYEARIWNSRGGFYAQVPPLPDQERATVCITVASDDGGLIRSFIGSLER